MDLTKTIELPPMHISPAPFLVVTDLDGTLLDHNSYSFQPALTALHLLGAKGIPVILCSSKTRTEITQIRRDLNNTYPFIVENGAAICGVMTVDEVSSKPCEDYVLGRAYSEIIAVLANVRQERGFKFRGFNDLTTDEVAEHTGLNLANAEQAKVREFSEPLIWDDSEARKGAFLQCLADYQLSAQQGGRFLTVAGLTDKGRAVAVLRELYGGKIRPRVIALGDSPNDEAMLNAADIAVIVKSDNSARLNVHQPTRIIHTQERGPTGWNNAILQILEEENNG